uniref:GH16 domain-containing protein n=1 Tax=Aegilops tauschii subsp. strangulata TaxID=200361 RepID=A0A453MLA7_AEGTS
MAAAAVTLLLLFASCMHAAVFCAAAPFDEVPTVTFDEGFAPLFGESNMGRSSGGDAVSITLDRSTGSGFISKRYYHHGLFSADVKLPAGHTAGVVVAFYLSNGDVFEATHDELDFEFLGNRAGHRWRMQTNVYGNGSTARGREERYVLPFDPTAAKHRFSILWSSSSVVFYVDGTPVREAQRRRNGSRLPVQAHGGVRDHLGRLHLGHGERQAHGGLRARALHRRVLGPRAPWMPRRRRCRHPPAPPRRLHAAVRNGGVGADDGGVRGHDGTEARGHAAVQAEADGVHGVLRHGPVPGGAAGVRGERGGPADVRAVGRVQGLFQFPDDAAATAAACRVHDAGRLTNRIGRTTGVHVAACTVLL